MTDEALTLEELERYASGDLDVRERARIQLLIESNPACKQAWREHRDREKLADQLRQAGVLKFDEES